MIRNIQRINKKAIIRLRHVRRRFVKSEQTAGILLITATLASLILANSALSDGYLAFWNTTIGHHSIGHWINDGLMVLFFFKICLELKEEVREGALSDLKQAMLPAAAALGGMLVPAAIFFGMNNGLHTQSGTGIPMATDIAFALGILSLLGNRVPFALRIFLTALAVIDDLGAILVIALFYPSVHIPFSGNFLIIAAGIFTLLMILNKVFKVKNIIPYLIGGVIMWYFTMYSGIHATIAGVLTAIALPDKEEKFGSPLYKMQYGLHYGVDFFILPLFALANTAIPFQTHISEIIGQPYGMGIFFGLLIGKPLGISIFTWLSVKLKICTLPYESSMKQVVGVGLLGGIGFTMSIFISMLAFTDPLIINGAKLMILLASALAGIIGFCWLSKALPKKTGV